VRIARVVPIEDIVERHLKLRIDFDDMHQLFNQPRSGRFEPDILGAIWFDRRSIVIDESLDPEENPSKEGRYRFTLAHEGGGHWRLHRHLFAKDPAEISFVNEPASPSVVCRSRKAKDSVEWQADFYASCLLMPRTLVMAAWDEMFPDCKPRVLRPETPIGHPYVEIERMTDEFGFDAGTDECVLNNFARPLAEQFLVSPIAMRIRLEKLGLLLREVPEQRTLLASASSVF